MQVRRLQFPARNRSLRWWRAQDPGHETRPAELQVPSYSVLRHCWWVLQDYLQDLLATTAVSSLQQIGNRYDSIQLHYCTCNFV